MIAARTAVRHASSPCPQALVHPAALLLAAVLSGCTSARTATPAPPPTSTLPPAPTPVIVESPLFADGAAGRVYASGRLSGTAQLKAYDARSGRLVDSAPIEPEERLLDIDRRRGRLALWSNSGVRWLDGRTLAQVGRASLPAWDVGAVARAKGYLVGLMDRPLLDARTGQILLLRDQTIETRDGETGALVAAERVPVPDTAGPIVDGALSEDGRLLYVAVADHSVATMGAPNGALLLALDRTTGAVLERRVLDAWVDRTLSWGNSWLVVGGAHWGPGAWNSLWVDGHERRRLFGADIVLRWSVFDARRRRLLGFLGPWQAIGDPQRLDLTDLFALPFEPPHLPWDDAPLTVYDATTDALYGRAGTEDRLLVIAATRIAPEPAGTDDAPSPRADVRVLTALLPPPGAGDEPLAYAGIVEATPGIGTPTPDYGGAELLPAIRRSREPGWHVRPRSFDAAWPGRVVAAPAPLEGAGTGPWLFRIDAPAGVFRSTDLGRSWQPASAGIDAPIVDDLDVSPDFARDATLFATSYATGPVDRPVDDPTDATWRSFDGGDRWIPVGRFRALALSPDFARDRTVMAFGYYTRTFFVSTDAGDTWTQRGRLPDDPADWGFGGELGPYPRETWIVPNEAGRGRIIVTLTTRHSEGYGPALYRSADDGASWRRAWASPDGTPNQDADVDDPQLLGRTGGTLVLRSSLHRAGPLLSRDGGRTWFDAALPDDPDAVPLAVGPDGVVLGVGHRIGAERAGVWTRPIADFVAVPTPAP
ncbi:MAG: hypothetical protein U0470_11810 [Anaerolineae bacterium]